jgi:HK97 family phage major capsid protein
MPEATTGLKPILFGNFKEYTIMDRANSTIQKLIEKYATAGKVGFLGKKRVDGKLMRSDALKYLIMA